MQRRTFLQVATGLLAVDLFGCGGGQSVDFTPTQAAAGPIGLPVQGRIEAELEVAAPALGSAYGPSSVQGLEFTTSISGTGVGLLVLEDSLGGVRGFTLTFPDQTPILSFDSTALAIVWMEPGFLLLDEASARAQIDRIRASAFYPNFVGYLKEHAGTPLDRLSGEADYVAARDGLLNDLGTPYTGLAEPNAQRSELGITFDNSSPRFLAVSRDNQFLSSMLPAYGTLTDPKPLPDNAYLLEGLGTSTGGVPSSETLDQTFPPTVFSATVLPLMELASGKRIPRDEWLDLLEQLGARLAPLGGAAFVPQLLAEAIESGMEQYLQELSANEQAILTLSYYVAGFLFSVGAIVKFKQHKDNPTQLPIGSPVVLNFLAKALLALPSIRGWR